jgi:hypothetical protein
MDKDVKECIDNLGSANDNIRFNALQTILTLTENRVDWAYKAWDNLAEKLEHENSYQRSIGILVLCNLAKSDPENRINDVLDRLLAHTRDDKFITSRQCIQNIWKAAAANTQAREKVLAHLEKQFSECAEEKHSNLIRQDIIQSIRLLYDYLSGEEKDEALLARAQGLIAEEEEEKYRKKYAAILKAR